MSLIDDLSPAERLALIGKLWDSLEEAHIPVILAQLDELDRRLATADADSRDGATWEQLKAKLRHRAG